MSYWESAKLIGTAFLISCAMTMAVFALSWLVREASVSVGRYLAGLLNEKAARAGTLSGYSSSLG